MGTNWYTPIHAGTHAYTCLPTRYFGAHIIHSGTQYAVLLDILRLVQYTASQDLCIPHVTRLFTFWPRTDHQVKIWQPDTTEALRTKINVSKSD